MRKPKKSRVRRTACRSVRLAVWCLREGVFAVNSASLLRQAILTIVVPSLMLGLCATAIPAAVSGGALVMGLGGDPGSLSPCPMSSTDERAFVQLTYDDFIDYDAATLKRVNTGALQSWTASPDHMSFTLRLWPNMKFHDGSPATAEDVKWSIQQAQGADCPRTTSLLNRIGSVTVVDPLTVKVTLKQADSIFEDSLTWIWLIKNGTAVKDLAAKENGTGGFKMARWDHAQQIVLNRDPNYRIKGRPYLESVIIKVVPDDAVRLLQLNTGAIQMTEAFPFASVNDIKKNLNLQWLQVPAGQSLAVYVLELNDTKPPFNNKLVRQAVAWAIDRRKIQQALFGLFDPRPWSIPKGSPFFAGGQTDYSQRNIAKAKELLAQAGSPSPEFTLHYFSGFFDYPVVAQIVGQSMQEAGFKVNFAVGDLNQYIAQVLTAPYNYQAGISGLLPAPNVYDQINHIYDTDEGLAYQYDKVNPSFYQKLDAARSLGDPNAFKKAIQELQMITNDEQPIVVIGAQVRAAVASKKVHGYIPHAQARPYLINTWVEH